MFSSSCLTPSSELKIVGTTTKVRADSGMPFEVSILGGVFGFTINVMSRFKALNARSLAGTITSKPMNSIAHGGAPDIDAYKRKGVRIRALRTATAPRYAAVG